MKTASASGFIISSTFLIMVFKTKVLIKSLLCQFSNSKANEENSERIKEKAGRKKTVVSSKFCNNFLQLAKKINLTVNDEENG